MYVHVPMQYVPIFQRMEGKELRLKQEYFLCSATLQDVVRRFKTYKSRMGGSGRTDFSIFAKKVQVLTVVCIVYCVRKNSTATTGSPEKLGKAGKSGYGVFRDARILLVHSSFLAFTKPWSLDTIC